MSLCALFVCQHVCVGMCLETNVYACTWAWQFAAYVTLCGNDGEYSEDSRQGTWQVLESEVNKFCEAAV